MSASGTSHVLAPDGYDANGLDPVPWRPHGIPTCDISTSKSRRLRNTPQTCTGGGTLLSEVSQEGDFVTVSDSEVHEVTVHNNDRLDTRSISQSHESRGSTRLVFEKRPRRRTRSDRYDTKGKEQKPNPRLRKKRKNHPSKSAKEKDIEKRKTLKSGRDVIKRFSSRAISDRRLTVGNFHFTLKYTDSNIVLGQTKSHRRAFSKWTHSK